MTMDECPPDAVNAADEILGPTLVRGRGEDIAILFRDEKISFNRLDAEVTRFGNALRPHVGKGDRVLLLLKDSPVFVAAHLGAMRIGAVAVALNVRSSAQDIAFVIGDSEAKVLLLDDDFVPLYERAIGLTERRPDVVAVVGAAKPGLRSLDEFLAGADKRRQPATTVADDMAFWLYTSGTTGKPKAAIHCHGDVTVGDAYMDAFGFGPGERVFASSKLFFAFSLGHVLVGALRFGCTIILHDGWPDSGVIAEMVERYRPTIMLSVPAFYRTLLQEGAATRPEFKTVRCYLSAGEALPETLYRRWHEATGVPIVEGIGATETIFMMVGGTPADHRPGATGKPFPYAETRLLDGQEQPVLATDAPGVLWARMGSLCRGYWRRPDATGIAFRDGWFRTGDVFTIDDEGWWYHQGRADDLLKISGQWVSPTEIEECAVTVPGVAEAIVVGVQDEEQLVRLNMFLVAPDGGSAELQRQVQDKLLQTLSQYKCPRRIVFIDSAPRTTTGKVRRFRLRQWAAGRYLQRLIAALGLDAAGVEQAAPQVFQTMQRKCVLCECYERCETDLAQGTSGSYFRDYCPNSDILVTLRVSPQAH
jgi:benzoate-CoA ligase